MTKNNNELFVIEQKKMMEHALMNKEKKRKTMLTDILLQYSI